MDKGLTALLHLDLINVVYLTAVIFIRKLHFLDDVNDVKNDAKMDN